MAIAEGTAIDVLDTLCTPCTSENKPVAAFRFCAQCREYLCQNCVWHHKKLRLTKYHYLSAFASASTDNNSDGMVDERCLKHNGKMVSMFCSYHEEIGCHVCMSENHSECDEIIFIWKHAKDISTSPELQQVKEDIEETSKRIKSLRNDRQKDLDNLSSERDVIINSFIDMTRDFVKKLEEIESKSKDICDAKYLDNVDIIRSDISDCDALSYTLDTMLQILISTVEEPRLFLEIRKARRNVSAGLKLINSVSQRQGKQHLLFSLDKRFKHLLDGAETFGQVNNVQRVFEAKLVEKYNVSISSDREKSDVMMFGCAQLLDGRTLVSDFTNKRLKVLDTEYKVASHIELCGNPCDVCITGEKEAAVCIFDRCLVQFISFKSAARPTRSFKTELKCQGITFDGTQLFVTVTGDSINQVRIYTVAGSLQQILQESDEKPLFSSINQIAYCPYDSRIYVTDTKKGVVCLNPKGQVVRVIQDKDLLQPTGVTTDGDGGVFVAGFKTNNVIYFGNDGTKLKVLLSEKLGIKEPLGLCFDQRSLRLITTMAGSKFLRVFQLRKVNIE